MLAISGMHKGETKLTIPNQVVCEQLFAYILDTYHENDLTFDSYEKRKLASGLAYDGKWKPYFEYIAGCLHRYASQRAFPERKDLHVGVRAESPVCHLVIIAGSVDVAAQYQAAVFRYNSFRLVAVFRNDLVGTLEGVPYSYIVFCHNSYDLVNDFCC